MSVVHGLGRTPGQAMFDPRRCVVVRAYILIEMVAGHSRALVDTLKDRRAVTAVDRVTGPYDVIAILEAPDLNQISDIMATEIHSLSGVVRTTTCVCLD